MLKEKEIKIDIKRWDNGEIIFTHSCPNNTVKITLEKGVERGVNFYRAKLNEAKLNGAKLNGVKLNGAELNGAKLNGAKLPKTDIIINDQYHIHIRPNYIRIGCEKHPISWFKKLTIKSADKLYNAGDWWKNWKPIILAIYDVIKGREV